MRGNLPIHYITNILGRVGAKVRGVLSHSCLRTYILHYRNYPKNSCCRNWKGHGFKFWIIFINRFHVHIFRYLILDSQTFRSLPSHFLFIDLVQQQAGTIDKYTYMCRHDVKSQDVFPSVTTQGICTGYQISFVSSAGEKLGHLRDSPYTSIWSLAQCQSWE